MGGGASKEHHEKIKAETEKPVDGTDIDTPRGVSAKEEVKRLRQLLHDCYNASEEVAKAVMGHAPSLESYLSRTFKACDKDNSGSLSKKEFFDMLEGLNLNLTKEDIEHLQTLTDNDGDENISLEEFVKCAPDYFRKMAGHYDASPGRDWAPLEDESGHTYYYNKRTGESQWEAPQEYIDNVEKDAAQEENKMSPDLKGYLTNCFKGADGDGSGELSLDEFWNLLQHQMNLNLTEEKFEQLRHKADVDGDQSVKWAEFVLIAPPLIQALHDDTPEEECWSECHDDDGTAYYINTKTGASQWEKPECMA
mmetsp:Transcript_18223/g.29637  ORF Transcript_18223/g.29637 Transcript_18223/m.29637 type:complete len:308 (+) Transcript_18223:73-996(+)|eukprot:CAMPEP_0203795186 /NCGR_PEP_ID=MMETSP0100_2-20121128/7052_1 /ASSEMBLY_ACC=CAM_ASM_000210 /TAXON_ID=96639 /ORGANISM=" , Strain NY0313808BC1" /LENGTH=307 /DNA_ID=CAMNT_0050699591 /DNA_START=50 /DNA_END=973 /DNA_ORIENTATION=-